MQAVQVVPPSYRPQMLDYIQKRALEFLTGADRTEQSAMTLAQQLEGMAFQKHQANAQAYQDFVVNKLKAMEHKAREAHAPPVQPAAAPAAQQHPVHQQHTHPAAASGYHVAPTSAPSSYSEQMTQQVYTQHAAPVAAAAPSSFSAQMLGITASQATASVQAAAVAHSHSSVTHHVAAAHMARQGLTSQYRQPAAQAQPQPQYQPQGRAAPAAGAGASMSPHQYYQQHSAQTQAAAAAAQQQRALQAAAANATQAAPRSASLGLTPRASPSPAPSVAPGQGQGQGQPRPPPEPLPWDKAIDFRLMVAGLRPLYEETMVAAWLGAHLRAQNAKGQLAQLTDPALKTKAEDLIRSYQKVLKIEKALFGRDKDTPPNTDDEMVVNGFSTILPSLKRLADDMRRTKTDEISQLLNGLMLRRSRRALGDGAPPLEPADAEAFLGLAAAIRARPELRETLALSARLLKMHMDRYLAEPSPTINHKEILRAQSMVSYLNEVVLVRDYTVTRPTYLDRRAATWFESSLPTLQGYGQTFKDSFPREAAAVALEVNQAMARSSPATAQQQPQAQPQQHLQYQYQQNQHHQPPHAHVASAPAGLGAPAPAAPTGYYDGGFAKQEGLPGSLGGSGMWDGLDIAGAWTGFGAAGMDVGQLVPEPASFTTGSPGSFAAVVKPEPPETFEELCGAYGMVEPEPPAEAWAPRAPLGPRDAEAEAEEEARWMGTIRDMLSA